MQEGNTIRRIREAVRTQRLSEPFSPSAVNQVLAISYAGVFLPKHRLGNPGRNTELFIRVSEHPALYLLR